MIIVQGYLISKWDAIIRYQIGIKKIKHKYVYTELAFVFPNKNTREILLYVSNTFKPSAANAVLPNTCPTTAEIFGIEPIRSGYITIKE